MQVWRFSKLLLRSAILCATCLATTVWLAKWLIVWQYNWHYITIMQVRATAFIKKKKLLFMLILKRGINCHIICTRFPSSHFDFYSTKDNTCKIQGKVFCYILFDTFWKVDTLALPFCTSVCVSLNFISSLSSNGGPDSTRSGFWLVESFLCSDWWLGCP